MEILSNPIISFIILLLLIVTVHEYGHFFMARLFNIKVEEFAIGFGKELIGFTGKSGTRFKFCLIPLGGYVKLHGHNLFLKKDNNEGIITSQAFDYKKPYQKMLVAASGPLFNFLLTIVILSGILYVNGEKFYPPQVKSVMKDSPAYLAGIEPLDIIEEINNHKIKEFGEIVFIVRQSKANENLSLSIKRKDKIKRITLKPQFIDGSNKVGIVGVEPIINKFPLSKALLIGIQQTYDITKLILHELWKLLSFNSSLENLGGIITISDSSSKAMGGGLVYFLVFVAMFSVNLAIINLVPIPVLDGGYICLYFMEYFINKAKLAQIYYYLLRFGIFLLIFLMVVANLNDIIRIYK